MNDWRYIVIKRRANEGKREGAEGGGEKKEDEERGNIRKSNDYDE